MKDIEVLNLALMNNWKWRIMNKKDVVWFNILKSRYDNPVLKVIIGDNNVLFQRDSIWWRDLVFF